MNMNELSLVQQRLNVLMRRPLQQVSRQKEMLLLTFGEPGNPQGTVTLRIQCFFRLMENGRILMASSDMYQPSEEMWKMWEQMGIEPDVIPEDFRPDAPGVNRLDDYLLVLNDDLEGLDVRGAMLGQTGDLTLLFSCGATLQVMVDTAGGEECWRLWKEAGEDGDADDLVVYGDGAELVRPEDDGQG